ncbi:MAG: hypothetical protein HZC12_00350 [Nitrospirae bacterium]|nr:hypothetical protein [Nitrospirota bacterium]
MPGKILKWKKEADSCKHAVIVDFVFDNGLFFISIKNIIDEPVFKVSIKFDKKIFGVEGSKEISALPLFQNIEFLPPQKEIMTFLDTSASYFRRGEPTKISARISYQDSKGTKYSTTIKHNLEIYKEIGYIRRLEMGHIT